MKKFYTALIFSILILCIFCDLAMTIIRRVGCDKTKCEKKCIAESRIGYCHTLKKSFDLIHIISECRCKDLHESDIIVF
ncbi:Hypothetical protein SRAE_1000291600 [Strongyloides ratti]|uniref:Uncharacterized protein n=1 Tax=Strongyloides ratti TaxID=34506 RepID=A0A090L943_STRRB|nr:Hypothetical protein SRAE_1000291600 [Strongyloides ratti]CEF64663.1 Hypothetical protein SRAE_1000291600 [Strongyloides ratti]